MAAQNETGAVVTIKDHPRYSHADHVIDNFFAEVSIINISGLELHESGVCTEMANYLQEAPDKFHYVYSSGLNIPFRIKM